MYRFGAVLASGGLFWLLATAPVSAACAPSADTLGSAELTCDRGVDFLSWSYNTWLDTVETGIVSSVADYLAQTRLADLNLALGNTSFVRESWGGTTPQLAGRTEIGGHELGSMAEDKVNSKFTALNFPVNVSAGNTVVGKAIAEFSLTITSVTKVVEDGAELLLVAYEAQFGASDSLTVASGGAGSTASAAGSKGSKSSSSSSSGGSRKSGSSASESHATGLSYLGEFRVTPNRSVPGPVAGAGLPALLVAGAVWLRRRRARQA